MTMLRCRAGRTDVSHTRKWSQYVACLHCTWCRLGCGVRPGVSGFKDQSHHAARRRKDAVFSDMCSVLVGCTVLRVDVVPCARAIWKLKLNSNSRTSAP